MMVESTAAVSAFQEVSTPLATYPDPAAEPREAAAVAVAEFPVTLDGCAQVTLALPKTCAN